MKFNLKSFQEKNRELFQLAYGIALLVLIPLLIVFNTIYIINRYNKNIDLVLQRQALTIGRTIAALMAGDLPWEYFVQAKLAMLKQTDTEVLELSVLLPEGDGFKVIASSDETLVNQMTDWQYYKIAWIQPPDEGLAIASKYLEQYGQNYDSGEDFWLVAMPMRDSGGEKSALLAVKLSSEIVSELTAGARNSSIYILVGTVIVVMLFLLAAIRLWDYALLYRRIKELDNMKNEFIAMASHELRTPVTGIRGHSSMILDGSLGPVSEKAMKSVSLISGAAERLAALVEDLLNVGRIEQGRMKIENRPTDIEALARGAVDELMVQAAGKKLKLFFTNQAGSLPKVAIDQARLKQVLINLIGNAIKYTPRGQVEVAVEKAGSDAFRIAVKDTGLGMSAKDRERLFEKFYRIQTDQTREITGTGLGLWITKQLVEMMHGRIRVDSIENVGTQFVVEFPLAKK